MQRQIGDLAVAQQEFMDQFDRLGREFPQIHQRLGTGRVERWLEQLPSAGHGQDDFGPEEAGGRGESYVRAQLANGTARGVGISNLLDIFLEARAGRQMIVDLLGGDGLVRRCCGTLGRPELDIVTCDASAHMVRTAWELGLPALRQQAEQQLFRSESVEGVLLAYGTHHIPPSLRRTVAEEAYRVLVSGGVFVLHDFLAGSPTDVWFGSVVDGYSLTGHQYVHFTRDEIHEYLVKAGFDAYELREVWDPYTASGRTPEEAELNLGEYLVNMYGLGKARAEFGDEGAYRWAIGQAKEIFRYPERPRASTRYLAQQGLWQVTVPRVAIVGVGRKF